MAQNNYNTIYNNYLSSKWKQWNDEINFPLSQKLLKAMLHFSKDSNTIQNAINENKNVFFWSDQHFFHNNIIKYANRPFQDTNIMHKTMIDNYLSTVTDNDIVVWGGDSFFGHTNIAKDYFSQFNLPGYKILILGNHDFEKNTFNFKNLDIFDEILFSTGFTYNINGNQQEFIITHYPIDKSLLNNMFNIHGHIHDIKLGLPYINMSVEITQFKPKNIQSLYDLSFDLNQPKIKIN